MCVGNETPDERWFFDKGEEEDPADVVEDSCTEEAGRCLLIGGAPDAMTPIFQAGSPPELGGNFEMCPDLIKIESSSEYN